MLNRVVLVGRLVRDPELRYTTSNNVPVVSFTLAVNRPFSSGNNAGGNDNNNADFLPCIAWRKQAENVSKYVRKGHMVAVDGRIQTRDYMDNTNNRRYVTEIICDSVVFLESKSQTDGSRQSEPKEPVNNDKDVALPNIEDDLPF
ncbi:MAG: single-stranded DNA-binding protein [Candidatus Izemoplasmatales bacterium]